MWFPHIAIAFVFVLDIVILYFLVVRFRWYAIVCKFKSVIFVYAAHLYLLHPFPRHIMPPFEMYEEKQPQSSY